jgi:hypothetical protein
MTRGSRDGLDESGTAITEHCESPVKLSVLAHLVINILRVPGRDAYICNDRL